MSLAVNGTCTFYVNNNIWAFRRTYKNLYEEPRRFRNASITGLAECGCCEQNLFVASNIQHVDGYWEHEEPGSEALVPQVPIVRSGSQMDQSENTSIMVRLAVPLARMLPPTQREQ